MGHEAVDVRSVGPDDINTSVTTTDPLALISLHRRGHTGHVGKGRCRCRGSCRWYSCTSSASIVPVVPDVPWAAGDGVDAKFKWSFRQLCHSHLCPREPVITLLDLFITSLTLNIASPLARTFDSHHLSSCHRPTTFTLTRLHARRGMLYCRWYCHHLTSYAKSAPASSSALPLPLPLPHLLHCTPSTPFLYFGEALYPSIVRRIVPLRQSFLTRISTIWRQRFVKSGCILFWGFCRGTLDPITFWRERHVAKSTRWSVFRLANGW